MEITMSTALQAVPSQPLQQWTSPAQIKARIQAIQQLMETTLKKDVDYGVIPGMGKNTKPSLWKPGSEQILAMFQIAVEPLVEDLSVEDCHRYRVTARLTNSKTGEFLGAGIGECSTDETKYKWRRTYSKPEFDNTPADRRRIKYSRYNDGGKWVDTEEMMVRQEPADLANTILKMAKKRAQIDATLTVTGASSMFEQDLEDLPEETREELSRQRTPRGKKEQKPVGDVVCADCRQTNGHSADCKYAKGKCPDCKAEGGHLPSCPHRKAQAETQMQTKPAEEKPRDLKWLVQVEGIDERKKTVKDDKGKERERHFLMLSCINSANESLTLYAWDTKMFDRLKSMPLKTHCIFLVKPQPSGDKTYYNVDEIVEITGENPSEPEQGELIPPDEN
jgi:hypothetical protein